MTSLESIGKLREWSRLGPMVCQDLLDIADEIEREIAERYMERPCDKNGEPTYVGQRIKHRGHEGEVWLIGVHEVMCSDRVCYPCGEYVHVKPRTVEDVLADVVALCANTWKGGESPFAFYDVSDVMESGNMREYADELRELLGGDGR